MSAWIVSKAHVDALVSAAHRSRYGIVWYEGDQRHEANHMSDDDLGRMLWLENLRSVRYRYPDDADGELPGPVGLTEMKVRRYRYQPFDIDTIGALGVLKSIACYEYQSCEHPEWEQSSARAFCKALESDMITRLPGYDDAPWGIERADRSA